MECLFFCILAVKSKISNQKVFYSDFTVESKFFFSQLFLRVEAVASALEYVNTLTAVQFSLRVNKIKLHAGIRKYSNGSPIFLTRKAN